MEQQYDFEIGTWLYIDDGPVEMLFRFLEVEDDFRWTTDEAYHVKGGKVYPNQGKFVITTNQQVVEADGAKVNEILALAESQNKG